MAKKQTKPSVKALISGIKGISEKDVKDIADFGKFILVKTNTGIIYRTHIGLEIRVGAWISDANGEPAHTTLYQWLDNLIDMRRETEKHKGEEFPHTGVTYDDLLDGESWMTWLMLTEYIMSSFSDIDTLAEASKRVSERLEARIKALEEAMTKIPSEETEEDEKANFKSGQEAIMRDRAAELLTEGDNEQ